MYGPHNGHLHHLEKALGVEIADRGNTLTLSGPDGAVRKAESVLNTLWTNIQKGQDTGPADIDAALRFLEDQTMSTPDISIQTRKKTIIPRTPNQAAYMQAMRDNPMVFGLGPAGTGKTYLAVAAGVSLYLSGAVERLIFTRPAVEAGEHLGFLPGDMKEKVDPYLRPIYDALHDMMPWDVMTKKIQVGDIEIAPLAFMRGRTLTNAFVILDEAQNATPAQMKMFLTRMGESSRVVVTGDPTQTDLPAHMKSGLQDALDILSGVEEIKFLTFENKDVIRHPLVRRIVEAYDQKK
ncbi:MAG: PhoH family protein [Alphaproteobacteria bacterium]|nr:PhoH family protein [Alphaproteobacteria bacterium]